MSGVAMRWRSMTLLGELSGRRTAELAKLLLDQVGATVDGARIARRAACADIDSSSARDAIVTVEHRGDDARAELVTTLAGTLVTLFDREDMFRMSRSIDDILDNLRDFVRELDLFQAPDERLVPVVDAIIDGLQCLHDTVAAVVERAPDLGGRIVAAKKACNDIRRSDQQQLVRILEGEVDAPMLRRRELLRRLDVVGLRLGEAVDVLADATVKRGM